MPVLNRETLNAIFIGFNAAFQRGIARARDDWKRIATEVPSTASEELYPWLKELPGIREWLGDRRVINAALDSYTIKNRSFEGTVGVPRSVVEDDRYGVFGPLFEALGEQASRYPNTLVFGLLKAGFTTTCYDGQYFFDTDHPVRAADGTIASVSNSGGGSGTPWFLLDTSQFLKPIIFQTRKAPELVRMDRPDDEQVFMTGEFRYGVDMRCNVGFGFWQLAYGSKQTLDATNYGTARAAMMEFKRDYGEPLGIVPNLLVVPPALEGAARQILTSEQIGGSSNPWRGTAELLVSPWLA